MPQKQAQDMSAALAETLTEWHSVGNLATKDDVTELKANLKNDIRESKSELLVRLAETKAEILKWLFAAIGTQTIVLLAALYGIIHSGHG